MKVSRNAPEHRSRAPKKVKSVLGQQMSKFSPYRLEIVVTMVASDFREEVAIYTKLKNIPLINL